MDGWTVMAARTGLSDFHFLTVSSRASVALRVVGSTTPMLPAFTITSAVFLSAMAMSWISTCVKRTSEAFLGVLNGFYSWCPGGGDAAGVFGWCRAFLWGEVSDDVLHSGGGRERRGAVAVVVVTLCNS